MAARTLSALMAVVTLAACAAPSQPLLDQAIKSCADGDRGQCNMVPMWQATVAREKQEQSEKVAAGILLGLGAAAAGAAAGYAASRPTYYQPVVVVCRPWWTC